MQLRGHEMSGRVAGFRRCVAALHSVQRGPLCNCSKSDKLSRGREVPGVVLPLCTSSTGLGENTRIAPSASPLRSFKCRRKQSSLSLWSPSPLLARRKPSRHLPSRFRPSRLSPASTSKTVAGQGVALSRFPGPAAATDRFRVAHASFVAVTEGWRYHRANNNRLGEVPPCNIHSFALPSWLAQPLARWSPVRRHRPSRSSLSPSSTTNTAIRPAANADPLVSASPRPIRPRCPIARLRPVRRGKARSRRPLTIRSCAFPMMTEAAIPALRAANLILRIRPADNAGSRRALRAGGETGYRVSFAQEGTQC